MKNKVYLSMMLIALLSLAGWTVHAQLQRSNQTRQTWDYKGVSVGHAVASGGAWSVWAEDDKPLGGPVTIASKIKELGDQRWEVQSFKFIKGASR